MRTSILLLVIVCVMVLANVALATTDTFGTGENQFTIDFVTISGDASSANGTNISQYPSGSPSYKTFTDPGDYRVGVHEITNDQWNNFTNEYGTVTGYQSGYSKDPYYTGTDVPMNNVSWYEAAQFVNWLNTSTDHQAAYKFTGTQGTGDYRFSVWDISDDGYDADNPYRNNDAFYFLPTEDEWVKAAYWNGTTLQTYATTDDSVPVAGDYTNYDGATEQPWDVGSGSEELNGTFDMMGNVLEWMESPYNSGDYLAFSSRGIRGGDFVNTADHLSSSYRVTNGPGAEGHILSFRVASVPEPATLLLLGLGAVMVRRKR